MKNLTKILLALFSVSFILLSCDENLDPLNPNGNDDDNIINGQFDMLWSYDIDFEGGINDIIPAIDENDNIYFSTAAYGSSQVKVFCIDKNGNELWKKEVNGTQNKKLIYANNAVYISTLEPAAIYCLNASDGESLWSVDYSEEQYFEPPLIAYNNNTLYVANAGIMNMDLFAYDEAGNELWSQIIHDMTSFNMSIDDNKLYFHGGAYLYCYTDFGNQCDSSWACELPMNKSYIGSKMLAFEDLPIDEDGNVYIRDESIYVVGPEGNLTNTILLDDSFSSSFSNLTLTKDNNIIIGNGNLVQLSSDGSIDWETNITGTLVSPYFSTASTIASNGNLYDAQLFGLYCVNSSGNLEWQKNAENGGGTEHGNLHTPVLNHAGNIISISTESKELRCFKGDGSGLASQGWPKPYGDYGNTSAK